MGRVRHALKHRRAGLALLLAVTLLMKLLVPVGYMATATAAGFRFELCSGVRGQPVSMPQAGAHDQQAGNHHMADHHAASGERQAAGESHDKGHGSKPDMPCAFAGVTAAADGAASPALEAPLQVPSTDSAPRPLAVAVGRGLAAPPPPATGPPLL